MKKMLTTMILALLMMLTLFTPVSAATKKKTTYTIKYCTQGGTKIKTKKVKSSKKKIKIRVTKQIPKRNGYKFLSWSTKSGGNGKKVRSNGYVTLTRKKRTLRLYAVWGKVQQPQKKPSTTTTDTSKEKKNTVVVEQKKSDTTVTEQTQTQTKKTSKMEVYFLNVGQGDATVIICDGDVIVIDAGDCTKGTTVEQFLSSKGVKKINFLIGTSVNPEHIGGMAYIANRFEVSALLLPKHKGETQEYENLVISARNKNLKISYPASGAKYQLADGNLKFQIVSSGKSYESAENASLCIRLVHGENSFLFAGDVESAAQKDIIGSSFVLASDVYKVAQHGSKKGVENFVNVVNPAYAVISCGKNNKEGYPQTPVLNALRQRNCATFRTDEQGTVYAVSDKSSIKWNTNPSTTWQAGKTTESESDDSVSPIFPSTGDIDKSYRVEYVINLSNKVFHEKNCKCVTTLSSRNKKVVSVVDAEDLISQGYSPCEKCNPK